MISYESVAAAADWLSGAFGFSERAESRYTDDDGTVTHAELELDGALVMLGHPGPDYRSPRAHAEVCEHARRWLEPPYVIDGVHVTVDDLDAHHERARAAGATILMPPTTAPYGRYYTAADAEGHRRMFMAADALPPPARSVRPCGAFSCSSVRSSSSTRCSSRR